MSKCADSLERWNTRSVATRVVETVVAGLLILMMAACNVGPNYNRSATSTAQSFRGALAPEVAARPQAEISIGDPSWSTIFQDPILQRLVAEALKNNLDLRMAAQRVLEAPAQVGITRSQQLPSVNAGASYSALQIPSALAANKSDGTPAN
jgi:outer membrane protein, multidrug efflux system